MSTTTDGQGASAATHTLFSSIDGRGAVTRPCNGYCRGNRHCWLVFDVFCDYSPDTAQSLREFFVLSDPTIRVIAVEPAPEARPYPDTPPDRRYGWIVVYEQQEAR